MVQASVGGCHQLQSAELDVVQRLVSSNMHSSAIPTSRWKRMSTLYGSTTVSDTLGDRMNETP